MKRVALLVGWVVMVLGSGCVSEDGGRTGYRGDTAPIVASATLDRAGGNLEYGPLTLVVPEGALAAPTTITLRKLDNAARGAVGPAWEFGPDGLTFAVPATLTVNYDTATLPPGTDPHALRLSVLEDGRWRGLANPVNHWGDASVVGSVEHFSTYGVVADPREVDGRGTRWEANGIVVQSSAAVFGRLYVSPLAASMFVEDAAVPSLTLSFSGLPTDEANQLYVDDYRTHLVVEPSAGGVASVAVDGTGPHYLWLQPSPGTVLIGGPTDGCAAVGVRSGNTCTLTMDVSDGFSIEAADQELDCAGHRIQQPPVKGGTSIGILVSGYQRPMGNVKIRNCVIGGAGGGFFQALDLAAAPDAEISDCVLEDNGLGIYVQKAARPHILRNRVTGSGNYALQIYDGTTDGEVADNQIALAGGILPTAMMFKGGNPAVGGTFVARMNVHGNVVTGGDIGMRFIAAQDNQLTGNDVDGAGRGLWIGLGGWPNRLWWNDIHGSTAWGVWSEIPKAELSDGGRGNWWGRSCPGALFLPSVDSSESEVVDSFPYGTRDGWATGETPNCGAAHASYPICPDDGSAGAADTVWDDYVPSSPAVQAAWSALQAQIRLNEVASYNQTRTDWAARGLNLPARDPPNPVVLWNRGTDNPKLIAARMTAPTVADANAVVNAFVNQYGALFGSRVPGAHLPGLFKTGNTNTPQGTFLTFDQRVGDLPIVGGGLHFLVGNDGALLFVAGNYYPQAQLTFPHSCRSADALRAAEARFLRDWPDTTHFEEDAVAVALPAGNGRLLPAWQGHLSDADRMVEPDLERYAEFVVDAGSCTVIRFGAPGSSSTVQGVATTMLPNGGGTLDFHRDPGVTGPAQDQLWVDNRSPYRLQCGSFNALVYSTATYQNRDAPQELTFTHWLEIDTPSGPMILPAWLYPAQQSSLPTDCYPQNTNPHDCDDRLSRIECSTALSRIERYVDWLHMLHIGHTPETLSHPSGVNLRCHYNHLGTDGETLRRSTIPNWLHLRTGYTTSLGRLLTVDHEYTHQYLFMLLRSIGLFALGNGNMAFDRDNGQSWGLDEVLPDVFANFHAGIPAGLFTPWLDAGAYPTQDLQRRWCKPEATILSVVSCGASHPCPSGQYCYDGTCTSYCMFIDPGANAPIDSYHMGNESGDKNGHSNENGRVLYQALTEFRERFGSDAFDHSPYASYNGPEEYACWLNGHGRVCNAKDWGASHLLDSSPGLVSCDAIGRVETESLNISEPSVGKILAVFGSVHLPSGAVLQAFDYPDGVERQILYQVGPFDWDRADPASSPFPLYTPWAEGERVHVVATLGFPASDCRTAHREMFTIIGWRHVGGMVADRLVVWGAADVPDGYIDWYEYYGCVMSADRVLYPEPYSHSGFSFQQAFVGHGIDRDLGDFCRTCPADCHPMGYLPNDVGCP